MADTSPFRGFRGFNTPNNTQVPDELFDELLVHLSGAELKVLLYIIRRTYGFKRESDNISLSQMLTGIVKRDGVRLDHGTGLSKPTLLTALRTLAEKHLIVPERRRSSEHGDQATTYRLHFVNDEQTNGGPPKGGNTGGNETDPPVVKKFDQGEEGNLTTPVAKELDQAVVKKSAPQVTVTNNQVNKVVNVTANDHENPSRGRTPDGKRTPVISKAGLRSKYQLNDDQISRVFWLVEKQATTLGAVERNHAHYVKRAAESVRAGTDDLLDLTLGDFKQASTDIAVGTKPAYFHSMWLEALEQRTAAASAPRLASSPPTRTTGPQPVADLFRRPVESGSDDSRDRMIADAERRGVRVPDYIRTADLAAVGRWWATLPEPSTTTHL